MATVKNKGIARAAEIYEDREKIGREFKAQGKTVMGYLCIYPVTEMMTAFDMVPYRTFGDIREPITAADGYMGSAICAFLRSTLDVALKGRVDFINGMVFARTCDMGTMSCGIWRSSTIDLPYSHLIPTPSTVVEDSVQQMKALLKDYQISLEEYTGKKLDPEKLKEAIRLHNEQRALVRELYDLKKPDPPLVSQTEVVQVIKALVTLPIAEGNEMLREVIDEVKTRKSGPAKKSARLLFWGPCVDDTALIEMIESLDANIVMDDTCVGTRAYMDDVKPTDDPLDGLAHHYLVDLKCSRTIRESQPGQAKKDYMKDIRHRYSYLGDFVRDWKVNGVILQSLRYCDAHGYDVPGIEDYFRDIGLPTIYLEHDYSEAALAPLKTRVQAFIELIANQ
ncbi:MAG: 2-hydroxyacyl-CoA dehydratase [Chloroflexi bacterium]|nr:2-hydroxyacyl-CoA dehydratase [Chloroflexota bacterium]